jgi:uncharacterized protein YggE
MYKTLLAFVLLVTTSFSYAQKATNDDEIIVEGIAKTKVKPDVAIITLKIEKTDSIEKKALEKLNKEVDAIVKSLYKIGFTNTTIKISDYAVANSRNEENYKDKYVASTVLMLEFGLDTKLINDLYEQVQLEGHEDLDISFESKLSDSVEKLSRIKLVAQAINNAKENAAHISKALNVKLLGVKQASKNQDVFFERSALYRVEDLKKAAPPQRNDRMMFQSAFDKFEVQEIELEERITIIYRISN